MSLTNTYETKVLKKLLGQDTWTTTSANLKLKVFSVSPGEDGTGTAIANIFVPPNSTSTSIGSFQIEGNRVASSVGSRQVNFTANANGSIVALALCDGDNPIWYEEITGTARRTYSSGDSLLMSKISFGFAGSAVASGLTNAILDQVFKSSATAYTSSYWPTDGLRLALYDGDPGFDGKNGTEVGPQTRVYIQHSTNSVNAWTVDNNIAYNANQIIVGDTGNQFPSECRVTHMALRSGSSRTAATDSIYWRGALLSPQYMRPSDKFIVEPGQLTIALD
jgi:hypothetical protein